MFFRKKGKMDELKKTEQEQVEEQVEELTDDQLESVTGGVVIGTSGFNPDNEVWLTMPTANSSPCPRCATSAGTGSMCPTSTLA